MTVQQLIEELQTLDLNAEVIIEENHGEYYPIREENFYEERITEDYYHVSEEDEGESMVVIRAS